MAYKRGGEAEKLGNQYEDNVLVYYYSLLMKNDYISIMSESYNPELEKGGDIYLKDKQSEITVLQVKSRNGNENEWSIESLISKGIIKNACVHISAGRNYCLVSPFNCILLSDICKRSWGYSNDRDIISGNNTKSNLSEILKLKKEINDNSNLSFINFCRHFSIKVILDDYGFFVSHFQANTKVVQGDAAFKLLSHYAVVNEKLSQEIYSTELWNYFEKHNIKTYSIDDNVSKQIINIANQFKDSIRRKLIKSNNYKRKEFDALLGKLSGEDIIIINGKSGTGKSGIALQMCEYLDSCGDLYLPISLDSYMPDKSTYEFGKTLGLPASPVLVLEELSDSRDVYLILDQLDAIRWNVTNATSAFSVCCELVKEVKHVNKGKIKLIFICRTVDADKILRFWEDDVPNLAKCSIEIGLLSDDEVATIVGKEYAKISPDIRKLIRNINILNMFLTIKTADKIKRSTDIICEFIADRRQEIVSRGFNYDQVVQFHKGLINELSNSQSISIPERKIKELFGSDLLEAYYSSGLIEYINSRVKFAHQSILDYSLAENLFNQIRNASQAIKVLSKYNNKSILRIELIKQCFEFLQTENDEYVEVLRKIIFSPKISSVIKQIAIESFKSYRVYNDDAVALFLRIIDNKLYGNKYLNFLIADNPIFIKEYLKTTTFKNLLCSSQKEKGFVALETLFLADDQCIDVDEYIFEIYDRFRNDITITNYLSHRIDLINSSDNLFQLKIRLALYTAQRFGYIDWNKLIKYKPERVPFCVKFILDNFVDVRLSSFPLKEKEEELSSIIKSDYKELISSAKKCLKQHCSEWELKYYDNFASHSTIDLARAILRISLRYATVDELKQNIYDDVDIINLEALCALCYVNDSTATYVLKNLVESNYIIKQDFAVNRIRIKFLSELIKRCSGNLNNGELGTLVNQIKSYISPRRLELAKERFSQRKDGYYYNFFEEEQLVLLGSVDSDSLNDETKNYLAYLRRKFPQPECYNGKYNYGIGEARSIVSGISKKWTSFSEKTWIQILCNPKTGKRNRFINEIDEDGNYVEYDRDSFCRIISTAAGIKQRMFVHILLNVPNIPHDFVNSILSGLYYTEKEVYDNCKGYKNVPPEPSAAQERVLAFKKYYNIKDKSYLHSFVWFAERCDFIDDWMRKALIEISMNPSQYEKEVMNVHSFEWDKNLDSLTTRDLETEKINRVQTCAINALANELFENRQLTDTMRQILELCINSIHPVLRLSAVDILYPIWNFDKEYVIGCLHKIAQKDIRVLCSYKGLKLLDLITPYRKSDEFIDILNNALAGDIKVLLERIVMYYCYYNLYNDFVSTLCKDHCDIVLHCCAQIFDVEAGEDVYERAEHLIMCIPVRGSKIDKNEKNELYMMSSLLKSVKGIRLLKQLLKGDKKFKNNDLFPIISDLEDEQSLLDKSSIVFLICNLILQYKENTIYLDKVVSILLRLYTEALDAKQIKVADKTLKNIEKLYKSFLIGTNAITQKLYS